MFDREAPIGIRPFRKDAYNEIVISSVKEPPIAIRIFKRNAYNESRITREEELANNVDELLTVATRKARISLDRAVHYSGILILVVVVAACVWLLLTSADKTQLDTATKLIFLIVGAVLGTLFPHSRKNK